MKFALWRPNSTYSYFYFILGLVLLAVSSFLRGFQEWLDIFIFALLVSGSAVILWLVQTQSTEGNNSDHDQAATPTGLPAVVLVVAIRLVTLVAVLHMMAQIIIYNIEVSIIFLKLGAASVMLGVFLMAPVMASALIGPKESRR